MSKENKETSPEEITPDATPQVEGPSENQESAKNTAPQFRFKRLDGRDQMKYEDVADK